MTKLNFAWIVMTPSEMQEICKYLSWWAGLITFRHYKPSMTTLKEHYVVASRNKVQLYKHYMRMLDLKLFSTIVEIKATAIFNEYY